MKRLSLLLAAAIALPAAAHNAWLLPSSTVLSSPQFVTFDAAVANDIFHFNHRPMGIEALTVTAPDGSAASPVNVSKGELRTTFDVKLEQKGTYRLAIARSGVRANWKEGDQMKRFMGTAEAFAKEVPATATDLKVSESASRMETFVTVGAPTAIKPSGKGLEMLPITHPNDLVAGEAAQFQFLIDGKPAAGVEVSLVRGQSRYRNQLEEQKLLTGADGKVSITFKQAGMYWLDVDAKDDKVSVAAAKERSLAYTATLEVLPQ